MNEHHKDMNLEQQEKEQAFLKNIYEHPYFSEVPRFMEHSRRNLIAFSIICIMVALYGPETIEEKTIKVWEITLNPNGHINVHAILTLAIVYQIFHFFSASLVYLKENRIRVTGTKVKFLTRSGSPFGSYEIDPRDHPSDPKQASLLWWISRNFKRLANEEKDLKDSYLRISTSLDRFNNYFNCFGKEQVFSRIGLDIILPLAIGLISFCIIWPWKEWIYGFGILIPIGFGLALSLYGFHNIKNYKN